jgi:hypothetical protein
MLSLIFATIMFSINIVWSIPFILTIYYGYQLYFIHNKETISRVSSKISNSSIKKEDNKPDGFFISWKHVGFFIKNEGDISLYIFCSKSEYEFLLKRNPSEETTDTEINISLYERSGNYLWLNYTKRELNVYNFHAKENQEKIIDSISEFHKKSFVTLIYGKPGTGKSMISILLAKKLNAYLVRTFNPTDPGDSISSLYGEINPTKINPLIIVFDEFDIMLDKIHNNTIFKHKNIPIEIYDKVSWNRFFDDINLGLYPNTIFILTSNISKFNLDIKYDSSYLRDGRIDLKFDI